MQIIGLSGYGKAGKDEVGRLLVEEHGYVRYAKGDLIKDAAWRLNPIFEIERSIAAVGGNIITRTHLTLRGMAEARHLTGSPVEQIDALKDDHPAVRRFLQDLADETIAVAGFDWWTVALYEAIERSDAEGVVLTRLSLPEEAAALWEHDGTLVRVDRPGYGPANDHPNEIALDDAPFDRTIVNDGTIDDLAVKVREMVGSL